MLNYLLDEDSGIKIFIISHTKSIPYADRTLEAVGILMTLIFMAYKVKN